MRFILLVVNSFSVDENPKEDKKDPFEGISGKQRSF